MRRKCSSILIVLFALAAGAFTTDIDENRFADSCQSEDASPLSLLQLSAEKVVQHSAELTIRLAHATGAITRTASRQPQGTALEATCRPSASDAGELNKPFDYWSPHSSIAGPYVKPQTSDSGLCYYPGLDCSTEPCCGASPETNSRLNFWSNWNALLCAVVWIPASMALNKVQDVGEEEPDSPPGPSTSRPAAQQQDVQALPPYLQRTGCQLFLNSLALSIGITSAIMVSIYISASAQTRLSVLDRNSMLAADAWLTPVGCVFQFLEDAMTVKIGYAMATGEVKRVKALLIVGILGGLACGVVAAGLLTALSFTSFIQGLLVPYSGLHTGCSLIPSALEIFNNCRGYFLLVSWCFPFNFISLALTGFVLGSMEFGLYGLAMGFSQGVLAAVWFGLMPPNGASPGLDLLGWAKFLSSISFVVTCLLGILFNPDLCQRYDISLFGSSEAKEGEDKSAEGESMSQILVSTASEASAQGASAMILDLCVQLNYAIGVYIAGRMGADQLYQISAMQAAMPMFGTAFAIGLGYAVKLRGGIMIGLQRFREFASFLSRTTLVCLYFAVVTVATTWPARDALAFYFASPACIYASEPSCLATYNGIFGGMSPGYATGRTTDLAQSFGVFSVAAAGICLFTALKAGLYCCFDFDFMAKCGIMSLILFAPIIAIASTMFGTAAAVYTAMYVPTLLLGLAFAARLFKHKDAMLGGESGPWDRSHMQQNA